jgi:hypothetical protein
MTGLLILSDIQQRVADELLAIGQERPVADLSWAPDLLAWINDALKEHLPRIGTRQLWISKGMTAGVLGCEARHTAAKDDFAWTRPIAAGVIVHHAVALAAAGLAAGPRGLANAALAEAGEAGMPSFRSWLGELSEWQRAGLVGEAVAGIDAFLTLFPPIQAGWNPVAEFPVRATFGAGRIRVSGRVDLALGLPRTGSDGLVRRQRLFVEIKTGRPRQEHRVEHLTYGLLELLRSGVAPFRSATFYTADGTWIADDIELDLLVVAARRLVDATRKLIELADGREPTRRAGWQCAFCPLSETCAERVRAGEERGSDDRW